MVSRRLNSVPAAASAPDSGSAALPAAPAAAAPASAPSLAEQAYAEVKRLIFDFTLMPGERFSEADLTQRVAVSRELLQQVAQQARQISLPRPDETLAAIAAVQAGR